jgi:hypothetical protein
LPSEERSIDPIAHEVLQNPEPPDARKHGDLRAEKKPGFRLPVFGRAVDRGIEAFGRGPGRTRSTSAP